MANKKVTYTLELDAEISSLENKLKGAKTALDGVLKSSGAPAGLKKSLESLEDMLGRLRDKASTPLETVGDAGKVKKDITAVMQALNGLNRIIEDLHNISGDERFKLLPPDVVQKLTAAASGIKAFEDSLKAATVETAALAKAREDLANATTGLAQKEADLQAKQGKLKENTDRRDQIKQEIAAIEERKKALEEAKKEQAKVDAFYSTPKADGTPKDRRQKYDGVSSTPAQAKKKTDNLAKQVAIDKGTLQNLSDELKIVNKDIESYSGQVATARRRADEAKTSLEGLNAKVESLNEAFQTDSAKKQQEAYDELRKTAAEAGLKMDDFSESFSSEEANKIIAALKKLKSDAMDGVTVGTKAATTAMDGFGNEAEELRRKTDAATESINEQNEALRESEAFENKIKQFLGLSGAAQVMRAALRDAMHTITELDATMTEMAVVTDLTVGDYWNQLPEYSKQASELGVSINSAYKAATLYYQQGLKGNEVTKISAETLKLAKIAGIDAADATNKMTAALRGFNMELNETSAQRVSDVYSELAAITAADVDEISNAMTKTASIAHSAGMEFETTAAFLSQIIETTRESAETAGTAMKTVIARFQELKKDPAEIGEVDGEIVDANKIETALRSVGVALRDSSGQFRALDDVFLELSSKWDGLDKNTQRYIATIAAGSRQQSRFIAMMSDYGRTQELVTSANNSAGASNKQFEKTMDSLEVKVEKLKNAWHEFTMGILESDLVKFGVDVLTKFLEIVNKATSGIDGLGGSLTKIISVVGIFKLASKIFGKIRQPLVSFFADVVKMSREEGEKAGKAFDESARKGATKQPNQQGQENVQANSNQVEAPKGFKQQVGRVLKKTGGFIAEKSGASDIVSGLTSKKRAYGVIDNKNNAVENFKKVASQHSEDSKEFLDAEKQLNDATKEYKELMGEARTEQEALLNAGYKGSQQVATGLQKAGSMMIGFGMACSMAGGALAAAGFEEAGETLATIGNWAMIAGSAISALGPIVTAVSNLAKAHGISTMAAWGWVLLIVAGIAILVGGIIAIFAQINNNSPEKKLQKAQEAADGAAKGAEAASEAYTKLSDSLNSLDEKQDTLEGLRKGTEEWNKAVQDVNSSVLDLIDKYPELAGFVENEGGVLTLDVDSDEVQNVLNSYKQDEIAAKGASIGAKANLARAQAEYDLSKMDDSVFEKFQTDGQGEAVGMAFANLGAATALGAAGGAAIGAGAGALIGGVGAGPGAIVGAITGGVAGLIGGLAAFQYTVDQVEKNNEQNRENVKELAQAYANGETGTTVEEISAYIERNGIAMGDAAKEMAKSLIDEAETMKEYGETLNALDAQEKAYYQAMATNAQQLVDLGKYNEQQMNQMTEVVDEDLMKVYEDEEKKRLKEEAALGKDGNFKEEKEKFAKQVYGENARVDGNKILNEKGEVVREFSNDEAWINEMAASKATLQAAEAMEQIPGALLNSIRKLEPELQKVFNKAFEGKDLTKSELESFKKEMGAVTYYDENGKEATSWENLDQSIKDIWGSETAYLKSLDADYKGIDTMWEQLSEEQKKAYGLDTSITDVNSDEYKKSLEKAKENFEDTFTEIVDTQEEAFAKAELNADQLGITLSEQLSSEAAHAWTEGIKTISLGAEAGEINAMNQQLNILLEGMTAEQVELVMAEINAMDKMDINAWNNLGYTLDNLGIPYVTDKLNKFTEAGILAAGAIDKINFDTLATDINNTYKLLDKIKEGGRTYSEADYKELIAGNKNLEKSFTQIGDDFIYVGGSMEDLTEAVKENTVSKLTEANRQLHSRQTMSSAIQEKSKEFGSVESMDQTQLINYLTAMRATTNATGYDLADFGIEGLNTTTDFSKATLDQLKQWAGAIAIEGGKSDIYKTDYEDSLRQANIQRYTQNEASYNAEMAAQGGEYADEHQEALILQAIQSGGVSNELIEAYREALDNKNFDTAATIGAQIAEATEKIVEASEGRDAYQTLVDRVVDAIEQSRQKEIDKLSEVNDSINTANQNLINKIQEQINLDRQNQANEEAQQNISDMYAQQAYLGMDTSGANSLDMLGMDQQIADAEKDMEQTLVDQAIQNLSDANEEAAQQRERQIDLLQQQLDWQVENGDIAREAESVVEQGLNQINSGVVVTETDMGNLLFGAEAKGLDALAGQNWASDLQKMATMASNWYTTQDIVNNASGALVDTSGMSDETAKKATRQNNRDVAINNLSSYVQSRNANRGGVNGNGSIPKFSESQTYTDARNAYINNAEDQSSEGRAKAGQEFDQRAREMVNATITSGSVDGVSVSGINNKGGFWGDYDEITLSMNGKSYTVQIGHASGGGIISGTNSKAADASTKKQLEEIVGTPKDGWIAMVNKIPYIYIGGNRKNWYSLTAYGQDDGPTFATDYLNNIRQYKTGGLADFTGPAWLDGTKSRPEYILNADQTERFFALVDVLEGFNDKAADKKSGDNYFNIQIDVEKLENDYDVEQMANKIRRMIADDAMYRNVNSINLIR